MYKNINPFFIDILSSGRMYELMDEWMDGRKDGWMDEWMEGWMGKQTEKEIRFILRMMPMHAPSYDVHNKVSATSQC